MPRVQRPALPFHETDRPRPCLGRCLGSLSFTPGLRAQTGLTVTTLHSFSEHDGNEDNSDGAYPEAALVEGRDGSFYGTTEQGGANAAGTAFRITPAGAFSNLYTFGALDGNRENTDGAYPYVAPILGRDGNLYGTTAFGGSSSVGTVYRITPAGVLTTLHEFGPGDAGYSPETEPLQGSDGNFYGTTSGNVNGAGTIFKMTVTST